MARHTLDTWSLYALVAALTLVVGGCGGQVDHRVLTVIIAGGDLMLVVGENLPLSVEVAVTGSASKSVTWSSSDSTVVSVSAEGVVSAEGAGTASVTATSAADSRKSAGVAVTVALPGSVSWTRQFGTVSAEYVGGVAIDADGGILVAGETSGALAGDNAGFSDAWVRKYDMAGEVVWTRQFGSDSVDQFEGVATDLEANVLLVGSTYGAVGDADLALSDIWVRKYDAAGTVMWTRQFGSDMTDLAGGVATDGSGNVIVVGHTDRGFDAGYLDVYVRKLDPDGEVVWTREFGSDSTDHGVGAATDGTGSVFVAGNTIGAIVSGGGGDWDVWVRKYDPAGEVEWTRQFGTGTYDQVRAIATDPSGNLVLSGETQGDLAGPVAGPTDVWVRVYNSAGDIVWTRQFGSDSFDAAGGVTADADGLITVMGDTAGVLDGDSAGANDAWVRRFDAAGGTLWTRQFGSNGSDLGAGVASDAQGDVVVGGSTSGALVGTGSGDADAWLRRYLRD
jgi:hypothetical protein